VSADSPFLMDIYLHDSSTALRFVLRGDLAAGDVRGLEHAWTTANSILGSKELVVDISGVTDADAGGRELLTRMRQAGARVTAGVGSCTHSRWRRLRDAICATSFRHLPGIRRRGVRLGDENTRVPLDAEVH
jgi:hypothetical protein